MPRLASFDVDGLAKTVARQQSIIGRGQAIACGMTAKALQHRIRAGGPWHVVLPGVYLVGGGTLTSSQRVVAAWVHATKPIAVTGFAAVRWHQIPAQPADFVDILVPPDCRCASVDFVRVHRTAVLPRVCYPDGAVSYADPARGLADYARAMTDLSDVRALVAAGVQRG